MIYGLFIPVYGIGLVAYHIVLSNIKFNKLSKWKRIIAVFFIPLVNKMDTLLLKKKMKIITYICTIYMLGNIIISSLAVYRQYQRRNNIEAVNIIDKIVDQKYTDDYLKKIYTNLREK